MDTHTPSPKPSWRLRFVNGAARSQNTRAEKEEAAFMRFAASVVRPAFSEIARRLSDAERTVTSQETRAACSLVVHNGNDQELAFRITPQSLPSAVIAAVEVRMRERRGLRILRKSVRLTDSGGQTPTLAETRPEMIITSFFKHYEDALKNRT